MKYLTLVGIDYENSSLAIREKVSFKPSDIKKAYEKIKKDGILSEAVIISTCNRSEIYGVAEVEEGVEYTKAFYSDFFNIDPVIIEKNLVCRKNFDVIYHLFQVANGFKSMVLGEDQILGQVKNAYNEALSNGATSKTLNKLFLNAITNAKRVKTATSLTNTPISVSSIGIKLIHEHVKSFKGKKALVIGLGKMSKLALQYLLSEGTEKIYVTNRTRTKILDVEGISDKIQGVDFKEKHKAIKEVDIIISSTSAPHFVLHKEEVLKNIVGDICMLDLAVPRDIEPSIKDIKGVTLYVIDDIKKISKRNEQKRLVEYNKGMKLVKEDVIKFIAWLDKANLQLQGCNNIDEHIFREEVVGI